MSFSAWQIAALQPHHTQHSNQILYTRPSPQTVSPQAVPHKPNMATGTPSKVMIKEANSQLGLMFEKIATLETESDAKSKELRIVKGELEKAVGFIQNMESQVEVQQREKDVQHRAQLVGYQDQCQNQLNIMKEQCKLQMTELNNYITKYTRDTSSEITSLKEASSAVLLENMALRAELDQLKESSAVKERQLNVLITAEKSLTSLLSTISQLTGSPETLPDPDMTYNTPVGNAPDNDLYRDDPSGGVVLNIMPQESNEVLEYFFGDGVINSGGMLLDENEDLPQTFPEDEDKVTDEDDGCKITTVPGSAVGETPEIPPTEELPGLTCFETQNEDNVQDLTKESVESPEIAIHQSDTSTETKPRAGSMSRGIAPRDIAPRDIAPRDITPPDEPPANSENSDVRTGSTSGSSYVHVVSDETESYQDVSSKHPSSCSSTIEKEGEEIVACGLEIEESSQSIDENAQNSGSEESGGKTLLQEVLRQSGCDSSDKTILEGQVLLKDTNNSPADQGESRDTVKPGMIFSISPSVLPGSVIRTPEHVSSRPRAYVYEDDLSSETVI